MPAEEIFTLLIKQFYIYFGKLGSFFFAVTKGHEFLGQRVPRSSGVRAEEW